MAAIQLGLFTKLSSAKEVTLDELRKELDMKARPAGVFTQHLHRLDCYK
jgi:hypothetical protein